MAHASSGTRCFTALLLPAALTLAACDGEEAEPTYETRTTDQSGGEFIVSEETPAAVPVDVPDTPMTPVPTEMPGEPATPAQ